MKASNARFVMNCAENSQDPIPSTSGMKKSRRKSLNSGLQSLGSNASDIQSLHELDETVASVEKHYHPTRRPGQEDNISIVSDVQSSHSYLSTKSARSRTSRSGKSRRRRKKSLNLEKVVCQTILQTAGAGAEKAHFLITQKESVLSKATSADFILQDLVQAGAIISNEVDEAKSQATSRQTESYPEDPLSKCSLDDSSSRNISCRISDERKENEPASWSNVAAEEDKLETTSMEWPKASFETVNFSSGSFKSLARPPVTFPDKSLIAVGEDAQEALSSFQSRNGSSDDPFDQLDFSMDYKDFSVGYKDAFTTNDAHLDTDNLPKCANSKEPSSPPESDKLEGSRRPNTSVSLNNQSVDELKEGTRIDTSPEGFPISDSEIHNNYLNIIHQQEPPVMQKGQPSVVKSSVSIDAPPSDFFELHEWTTFGKNPFGESQDNTSVDSPSSVASFGKATFGKATLVARGKRVWRRV